MTGANITKYAMVKMDEERIKQNIDVKFVLQLHDAIVCEVIDSEAERWLEIQKNCIGTIYIVVDLLAKNIF